jgi:hypothetical protein
MSSESTLTDSLTGAVRDASRITSAIAAPQTNEKANAFDPRIDPSLAVPNHNGSIVRQNDMTASHSASQVPSSSIPGGIARRSTRGPGAASGNKPTSPAFLEIVEEDRAIRID